jgi:N-acetylmuramoyl-L-alanine amidase
MKKAILITLLLFSSAYAKIDINVVYPRANQQVALVDSTFIFGNVPVGAKLSINGISIPVYKDGAWLAFLDVSPGPFVFHIIAKKDKDSTALDWPVSIGPPEAGMPMMKYLPKSPYPYAKSIYFVGDTLEFSFEARPGGQGWFGIDSLTSVVMYPTIIREKNPASAFGEISEPTKVEAAAKKYVGYYRIAPGDTGVHNLCYAYANSIDSAAGGPPVQRLCIDSIITVMPELPPLVGILSGQNHIIRTVPGMGYKLLYQPPGIYVRVIGMRDTFYKIALAPGVSGFINADSVKLLPPGTIIPEGAVSYVQVDPVAGGAEVSAELGAMVPYEIEESLEPPQLNIDFFGVTGSVDWIRYNNKSPLIKIVKWSQPQDKVFRMTVEIGKDRLWGYKASYDGNKFILKINEEPKENLKGLKIMIDPGHSKDPGAIGPTGLLEKDANLWIALKLRTMLKNKGAKVMMTRTGNEDVPLYDRPKKAEEWGADLLVSIHNNALPDGINPFYNNGTSVYYYFPHSLGLAEAVHNQMLKATGLPDHGLYYGNLVLTRYSTVPSILVECAFMIIPEQEAKLRTAKFQKACASAIMLGIKDFISSNY